MNGRGHPILDECHHLEEWLRARFRLQREVAEDLAQDVVVTMLSKPSASSGGDLRKLMRTIGAYHALNHLRRSQTIRERTGLPTERSDRSTVAAFDSVELRVALRSHIRTSTTTCEQEDLIALVLLGEVGIEEAALATGIGVDAMRKRLRRLCMRLCGPFSDLCERRRQKSCPDSAQLQHLILDEE